MTRTKHGDLSVFPGRETARFEEDDYNDRFEKALQELQQQSGIGKTERKSAISPIYAEVLERTGWNKFHGYDGTTVETANVVAIVDGDSQKDSLGEGEQGSVILDETPFYAESGGQVGDTGSLISAVPPPADAGGTDLKATVADTYSPVAGLIIHKVKVESGNLKVGDKVTAVVDSFKRDATRRNHTATHLLHAALKEVLGTHVSRRFGGWRPTICGFDFSHYHRCLRRNSRGRGSCEPLYPAKSPGCDEPDGDRGSDAFGCGRDVWGKIGAGFACYAGRDGQVFNGALRRHARRATGNIGSLNYFGPSIASGVRRIQSHDRFGRV